MRAPDPWLAILVPLLALGAPGGAWPGQRHAPLAVRPVAAGLTSAGHADDGLYLDATSAIARRDYAAALEDLQAADARAPNDVRVLNAFGVVYDKLGRFDLSRRYYVSAAALDPRSPIIANNLRYSDYLSARRTPVTAGVSACSPPHHPRTTQ